MKPALKFKVTVYFDIITTDKKMILDYLKGLRSQNYLSIKKWWSRAGEDIVAFGYPLSSALSSSVKLTRGIVSGHTR